MLWAQVCKDRHNSKYIRGLYKTLGNNPVPTVITNTRLMSIFLLTSFYVPILHLGFI